MKKKFDIKYRPQIESGQYRVVTHDGTPVIVEKWDLKGSQPILVILPTAISDFEGEESWVEDRPFVYSIKGVCSEKVPSDKYYQLYVDTGDSVIGSERMLCELVNRQVSSHEFMDEEDAREWLKDFFLPTLIKDCECNGDYFVSNGVKYLNIKSYIDGM